MTALFEKEREGVQGGAGKFDSLFGWKYYSIHSSYTRMFLRILEKKFYVFEKNPICMMRE